MRSPLLVLALTTAMSAALGAQDSTRPARFGFAVGPAWNASLAGVHLRAEYAVVRHSWFDLQVYAGGFWTPTQSYSEPSVLYGDGSRFLGTNQTVNAQLGLVGIIMPWRARVSPYLVTGIAAVHSWSQDQGAYIKPDGSVAESHPPRGWNLSRGDFAGIGGLGLRLLVGNRPIQFEFRRLGGYTQSLTLGTALPF